MLFSSAVPEITVLELSQKIAQDPRFILLDVREQDEYDAAHIPTSVLIPLGQLPAHLGELDPQKDIVVYCHSGGRSARAVAFLQASGFRHAKNLVGGILEWQNHQARGTVGP